MNLFEILAFGLEWLLLGLGIVCYLFAIGRIKGNEKFRRDNQTWLRYGGLLLASMMTVNIVLHFLQAVK
jgi:hypothetical protein